MDNIWLLTEEKPKTSVIQQILQIYYDDFGVNYTCSERIAIRPLGSGGVFSFTYEVEGVRVDGIHKVFIKSVSGGSSFLDFLFFVQKDAPVEGGNNHLVFAVEETKTSDDESRNTGGCQRCSKFVYIKAFYPKIPLYMLYNDELGLRKGKKPSDTSILDTNMLLTNQVKIVGKPVDQWFSPFRSIDELIKFKNGMRMPPKGNTPILINKAGDKITVSGRLDKAKSIGKIAHDPNIGALSYIAYTLRQLGWTGEIEIVDHHVVQSSVKNNSHNKFLSICKMLDIKMAGITMPTHYKLPDSYWHYEDKSEKVASILFHIACEYLGLQEVYQNHAGCERGYFKSSTGELIALPKHCGEDDHNLLIPDVIMRDDAKRTVYLMEGKKLSTLAEGLTEIEGYGDIEKLYINRYFPGYTVKRYLTIFGGSKTALPHEKVLLYLNHHGRLIMNDAKEPKLSSEIMALLS
ncbi:MAG: hypothetical protein IJV43_06620 [Oscillospiraceae bacterium]|nr:hypothetical protein [Oscillospiraceae bacterium]